MNDDTLNIVGSVIDEDGIPIEHIKVTLDWDHGKHQLIKYTSSTGGFNAPVDDLTNTGIINLTVTLEDIDGESNNGLFQSHTESLTLILSEVVDAAIYLEYRLTHASQAENI